MGETSHAKLWAIIAPLAALAGLAWMHFRKKKRKKIFALKTTDSIFDNFRRTISLVKNLLVE